GDDRLSSRDLEVADDLARRGDTALDCAVGEHIAACTDDRAIRGEELSHPVAREDRYRSGILGAVNGLIERGDDPRTRSPGDVEPGHRVAGADRAVATAFCPADDGEETDASFAQPGALLSRGELQVCLGPPARPLILDTVEA